EGCSEGSGALTEEQRAAVEGLISGLSDRQVQTLGGYAGTGKTTCIRELSRLRPGFGVCAFTGKAAAILRRKGIGDATTIHGLIYIREDIAGELSFRLRPKPSEDVSGFIVDESSMVAEQVYKDLLSFGLPCIFVGDHGQLEPVADKFNLMHRPDFTLEPTHRNAGDIPRSADH